MVTSMPTRPDTVSKRPEVTNWSMSATAAVMPIAVEASLHRPAGAMPVSAASPRGPARAAA